MIPNINNKEHFNSEFDLSKMPIIHKNSFGSFYKAHRNSDFLDYTLLIMELDVTSYSNQILQEILAFIPFTKHNPYLLEIHTVFSWEQKESCLFFSQKFIIAILMEKFDSLFANEILQNKNEGKIIQEKESLNFLKNSLLSLNFLINECQLPYRDINPDSFFIKNKVLKICELGTNYFNKKNNNTPIKKLEIENKYLYSIGLIFLDYFSKEKLDFLNDNSIDYNLHLDLIKNEKIKCLLTKLIYQKNVKISNILEELIEKKPIEIDNKRNYNQENEFYMLPTCKTHNKDCYFICQMVKCNKLLCLTCIEVHSLSHRDHIIEYKEFVKEKIIEGGSIKLLDDLLEKIKDCSNLMNKQYFKSYDEINNLFQFLEKKTLKILENKKIAIIEYINNIKNEDFDRLNIIKHQVKTHKTELETLLQTNEVKAPYLPDDIKRITPFLIEILSNFKDKFLEKYLNIKTKSLESRYLISKLEKNNLLDLNSITKKFNEILDNLCVIDPLLNDLEIEKLQTTFIDVKPIVFKEHNKEIKFLIETEKTVNKFLSVSEKDIKLLYSYDTAKNLYNIEYINEKIEKCAFSKKLKNLYFTINDINLKYIDCLNSKIYDLSLNDKKKINCLNIINEKYLAMGIENTISLLNIDDNKIEKKLQINENKSNITNILYFENNKILLAFTENSNIIIWEVFPEKYIKTINMDNLSKITSLLSINENSRAVIGNSKGSLKILDVNKFIFSKNIEYAHRDSILSLEFSSKLKIVITSGMDKRLIIWDIEKFNEKQFIVLFDNFNKVITSLGWMNYGTILIAGCENGEIFVINLEQDLKNYEDRLNYRKRGMVNRRTLELSQMLFFDDDKSTIYSKESSEFAKEKLLLIDDINQDVNDKKQRKSSVMITKLSPRFSKVEKIKYQDDSIFDKSKESILNLQEKRKSNLCVIF